LIGTYRQGRKFAALLYPVADMDLAEYLEEARYMSDADQDSSGISYHERAHQDVLSKGSLCLISALRYVHESGIKHMDIKPANTLLKRYKPTEAYSNNIAYKLYLCDFGLAQVLNLDERSQTETYPGKTPMYASSEVAAYDVHGRASDVFSLRCVLLEMATVYSGLTIESLKREIRQDWTTPGSYHTNLDRVKSWIYTLENMKVSNAVILKMLRERPEDRPSLVRQSRMANVIDLECLHHHDPPDLFEVDEASPPTEPNSTPPPPVEKPSGAVTPHAQPKGTPLPGVMVPDSNTCLPSLGQE
jgi:serine/threonine protein kinase